MSDIHIGAGEVRHVRAGGTALVYKGGGAHVYRGGMAHVFDGGAAHVNRYGTAHVYGSGTVYVYGGTAIVYCGTAIVYGGMVYVYGGTAEIRDACGIIIDCYDPGHPVLITWQGPVYGPEEEVCPTCNGHGGGGGFDRNGSHTADAYQEYPCPTCGKEWDGTE